jgi:AraC-like DNA-binding protein
MYPTGLEFKNSSGTFSLSVKKSLGHYNMSGNHFHHYYEVYYLYAGQRHYFIKDRTFPVQKGDLIFIGPYDLHKTSDAGVPDHERFLLYFTRDFLLPSGQSAGVLNLLFQSGNPVLTLSLPGRTMVEELLQKMAQETLQKNTGFELALQAYLFQLLVLAARFKEQYRTDSFRHLSPVHRKISEIVQYINGHYQEDLTLAVLADHFYISPFYLSRIFKEATGFTFIEYLNSVRIKEAQKLLKDTRWKVITVAEKVGFGNIAHFGRVFKSLTGQTPLQYRKRGSGEGAGGHPL